MQVGGVGASLRFGSFARPQAATRNDQVVRERSTEFLSLRRVLDRTGDLEDRLQELREALKGGAATRRTAPRPATVAGSQGLVVDVPATHARLESSEEANTTPTSFSPRAPAFAGASTVDPTIGGTYAGATDETLTFRVTRAGAVGGAPGPIIEVENGSGQVIQTITLPALADPDATYALNNGLELTLSSGVLVLDDTFTVDVSASQGTDVDPDARFDGVGNDDPELESPITAGSFEVNGQTIQVFADDTLTAVLTRIGQSGAGVTARHDAGSDRVVLESELAGPSGTVTVGADTSGFLAAFKLDDAQQVDGEAGGTDRAIADVPELAAVVAGSFTVNGTAIAIDPATTTLADLLAAIENQTGVAATFDAQGRLRLTAPSSDEPLELGADDTGLLDALGLEAGITEGRPGRRVAGVSGRRAREVERAAARVAEGLKALFDDLPASLESLVRTARSDLRAELGGLAARFLGAENGVFRRNDTDFGVVLDLRSGAETPLDVDPRQLGKALARGDRDVLDFFASGLDRREADAGFIVTLERAVAKISGRMATRAEFLGGLLDRSA